VRIRLPGQFNPATLVDAVRPARDVSDSQAVSFESWKNGLNEDIRVKLGKQLPEFRGLNRADLIMYLSVFRQAYPDVQIPDDVLDILRLNKAEDALLREILRDLNQAGIVDWKDFSGIKKLVDGQRALSDPAVRHELLPLAAWLRKNAGGRFVEGLMKIANGDRS